jgi:sortase A
MKRLSIILITLAAVIIFATTFVRAVYYVPNEGQLAPTTSPAAATVLPIEEPARLLVPSIHVDAAVQKVGVNAKGNMGVPNNYTDVAWYKYGTAPGQLGSSVIDGHVDNGLALSGVFKHLADVQLGDDVYVRTASGRQLHFKVVDKQSYPYTEVPLELVFARKDAARLNLITCVGAWVPGQKTYDQRLVVYTELVP